MRMRMRMRCFLVLVVTSLFTFGPGATRGQQAASDQGRRILRRVNPLYPEIAKKMGLSGTVKLLAVVEPDGTVKNVEPVGGGPVLIQAAKDAIVKWKYAPAAAESKEEVTIRFDPLGQ